MRRKNRELNVFGLSFMDILANTVGGLAFLLILAVVMIGRVTLEMVDAQITTEALPPGFDGQPYNVWLSARDGTGMYAWEVKGDVPPGLEIDQQSGKLSGVIALPSEAEPRSSYQFEVSLDDGSKTGAVTRPLSLDVRRDVPSELAPLEIMTEERLPDAYVGQPYPLVFAAQGGGSSYRWKHNPRNGPLPGGVELGSNGKLMGTPNTPGTFQFEISVSAPETDEKQKTFTLKVDTKYPMPKDPPPLRVVTNQVPDAVAANPYGIFLAAEGGVPPYRWRIEGSPSWLESVPNSAALFAGKPGVTDVGSHSVTFTVTDSEGKSDSGKLVDLKILPPVIKKAFPSRLKTTMLPDARVDQPYRVALSAQGGKPPYRWAIDRPLGDVGIKFTGGAEENDQSESGPDMGIFEGTATTVAFETRTVTVHDSDGNHHTEELTLRVRPAVQPIVATTRLAPDGRAAAEYDLALAATGGHPPYRWQLASGTLPPGLELDEGKVSGFPESAGTWQARFQLADSEGKRATEEVPLEFQVLTPQGNTKLVVKTDELPTLLHGQPLSLALAAEGGMPPYSWKMIEESPPDLDTSGSMMTGLPSVSGTFQTRFRVKDQEGQSADVVIPVTIRSMLPAWMTYVLGALLTTAIIMLLLLARRARSAKPQPLTINTQSLPNGRASCDYAVQLSCIGGSAPYRWQVDSGTLPPGLSFKRNGAV